MVKLIALLRRPRNPQEWMKDMMGRVLPHCYDIPPLEAMEIASPDDTSTVHGRRGDRRGPPFLVAELSGTPGPPREGSPSQ
ncbi:MAG: hypothetical protein E6G56_02365 [Actinobacteria bacterium]|nr:MAG: hypothetical protein E6G56_02365 [Actinomycetota bacterium]